MDEPARPTFSMACSRIMSHARIALLRLRYGRRISVDFATLIGPGCTIAVEPGGRLVLRNAHLKRRVGLEVSAGGYLEIGSSFVGVGTMMAARQSVVVGDGCQIAEYVGIRDHNHVHDAQTPLSKWVFSSNPISIGNDVWLASKVTVLAGVSVADHATCGAGAVVTRSVAQWAVVGGVPARPIGSTGIAVGTADGNAERRQVAE